MSFDESASPDGLDAFAELADVEAAKDAAVRSTRRPGWLNVAYATVVGAVVGLGLLRSTQGWVAAGVLFIVFVGLMVLDHRQNRRRGRLLVTGKGPALGFVLLVGTMMFLGQIEPPPGAEGRFALVAGVSVAVVGYGYLLWESADTARRLRTGDFSSDDLMP